jgi:hypothetical protein
MFPSFHHPKVSISNAAYENRCSNHRFMNKEKKQSPVRITQILVEIDTNDGSGCSGYVPLGLA